MKWRAVPLTDICRPRQWKTIPTSVLTETGYPVFGANGIIGFYSEYNHEKPTVVITCRGATCGTVGITSPKSYITGNAMALDDLDEDQVDQKFLYYQLSRRGFRDVISGTAQPQITGQGLSIVKVNLPPLPEQKRIAAILDKADEIRRKREKAIELTDSFLRSVFLEMFGDPATNPMGFKTVRFKDTVSRIFKGAFDLKAECYRALGVPFIRISNIRNGTIDLSDAVYVSDDVALIYEKASVEPGDLVFSKVGTIDRIAIVPDSLTSCIISQNNVGAKLKRDMIHPRFALAYLLHPHTLALIKRGSKKCVQDKLVLDELKDLPILLPSFDMQVKWAECVEKVKALQKSLSGSMGILGELQRCLGSTFFTSNVLGGRNAEPAQEAAHAL